MHRCQLILVLPMLVIAMITSQLVAQEIDSVHVFDALSERSLTTASANALAWRLHKAHAHHTTLKGDDIVAVREALAQYTQFPHRPGVIADLAHLAMVFTNGRPVPIGATAELDRVINFTALTEFRIDDLADHLRVRSVLLQLMMRQ